MPIRRTITNAPHEINHEGHFLSPYIDFRLKELTPIGNQIIRLVNVLLL